MARPMLLIQQPLLMQLYTQHKEGVPVSRLISKFNLAITNPTLSKLLSYMHVYDTAEKADVKDIVHASLFPSWLESFEESICRQPSTHRYEGFMPFGKWVENDWTS